MKLEEIKKIMELLNEQGFSEISLEQKDFKLQLKKQGAVITTVQASPQVQASATNAKHDATPTPVAEKGTAIKSPMIGTFYRKANPNAAFYVNEGDVVQKGKVICTIEAMKLFNEIECEMNCKIIKILVNDASPVQYDQPLFLVEPI